MKENFFDNINGYALDPQQRDAILKASKYSLIVAGAGSGKTLTLVGKIKYLMEVKGVSPEDILCISFTNESTRSLKDKINHPSVPVYTFHKLALRILEQETMEYEIILDDYLEEVMATFFKDLLWKNTFLKQQFRWCLKKPILFRKQYEHYLQTKEYKDLVKIIAEFVHLYSTHNLKLEEFKNLFQKKSDHPLLFLIYAVIQFYEKEKVMHGYYDFDDLIKAAALKCHEKPICHYKEIIIDEFQDTSRLRLQFIREVVKNSDANLTVVGDDFQSIYKFSGCDLNIFLSFQEYFVGAQIFKIENTYRNSQELIQIAGDFVMKNKRQISKDLKSQKHLEHPIEIVRYVHKYKALLQVIQKISDGEILILGRNNFDIYQFIPKDKITWKENGYFILENYAYHLRFLTVHKSKGLESDNVIVINLENSELGFPCQRKSHALTYLIQPKDNFLYEEERRLFYVALTRTKNKCFLLVPFFNPSLFVQEIKKEI